MKNLFIRSVLSFLLSVSILSLSLSKPPEKVVMASHGSSIVLIILYLLSGGSGSEAGSTRRPAPKPD